MTACLSGAWKCEQSREMKIENRILVKRMLRTTACMCLALGFLLLFVHQSVINGLDAVMTMIGSEKEEIISRDYPILFLVGIFFEWFERIHKMDELEYVLAKMQLQVASICIYGMAFMNAGMIFLAFGIEGAKTRLGRERKKLRRPT